MQSLPNKKLKSKYNSEHYTKTTLVSSQIISLPRHATQTIPWEERSDDPHVGTVAIISASNDRLIIDVISNAVMLDCSVAMHRAGWFQRTNPRQARKALYKLGILGCKI